MILAIYAIYITETISTGFLAYDLANLTVDPYYNPCFAVIIVLIGEGLGTLPSIFGSQYATDTTEVSLLTQAVYAYRIWILMERKRFVPFCFIAVRNTRTHTCPMI